ncbi:hypothetical protein CR513_31435, partial [Mucuna pruriens]
MGRCSTPAREPAQIQKKIQGPSNKREFLPPCASSYVLLKNGDIIYDDKVLIHYFQDSLTGAALSWYVILKRGCIKTWRDLTEAFLKQYKYNEDMAPD